MNVPITLDKDCIHIWSANLARPKAILCEFLSFLSPDEMTRADHYRSATTRDRFVAARGILRIILSQYTSINPKLIRFNYTELHKPHMLPSTLQFNVSHSNDMAVYAITQNHPVGIDIEKVKTLAHLQLAKRFFSPQEFDYLNHLSPDTQLLNFYKIWTRKEALLKAAGIGLRVPLNQFSMMDESVQPIILADHDWFYRDLDLKEPAALACSIPLNHLKYCDFDTFLQR